MVRMAITALVLFGLLATAALAEPAINVGTVEVFANSQGQAIPLFVTGGSAVTGFNLCAQIGDGTGPGSEPVIQWIGYAGSIWNIGSPGYAEMGGPVAEAPQFAQASVVLTTTATVPAAGLLATLTIDTRGFYEPTSFPLNLSGTEIGEDSAFILPGGGALPATIINGSIQVIAGGIWTGGAGMQWQTPGNWSSVMTPGPTFTAVFDGSPTANQPILNQAESVKGIVLRTAGWHIAADGNRTLSVGAKGLSSAGSGTSTIAPTVTFTAPATIDVGANNTLVLAAVTAGDNALEKSGQGTLVFSGANLYGGGTTVSEGTLLVSNASGSGTGTGTVSVGAATLGGTGFINGPVTLTGDSTLTSTDTLTINSTLTIQGLANQLAAGTVLTTGDVTIAPGAVFIINGTLGGEAGNLIVYGTLMGRGTINKSCIIEAGGRLSPGAPSTIETMTQMRVGAAPQNFSFEIAAAAPNYATPSNSLNDLVRLTSAAPFADAYGAAPAALSADTVIEVYFLSADPAMGDYKAQFFAATDFTDAIADATFQYWCLDPRGSRLYNGNFYSPLDESLVDWSVVPETATFGGQAASGYITEFTVVPEPATLALVAVGVAATLLRRRRR